MGFSWFLSLSLYIIYIYIYDPGPRSRSPPQWYGPLLPDLESFISMVFTAFWMQNLIFQWYLHQFGWYHLLIYIYIGTKEYSYITSWLPILPTGPTHLPHPQGGGGNHDHGGETIYTQLPFTGERGGTMTTYITYRTTSTRGRRGTMTVGGLPTGPTQLPHPLGGGGNHDHRGGGGVAEPGTYIYIYIYYIYIYNYRRKFRSQTSDKMDRWKAEQGRGREKRKIRRKKSKKKEDADARKGRKVAKHCVFPMIWGSGGSKSRLAKAAGAEPAGQMRDEKLHAVVARSRFPSQNVQNTQGADHFWQLRCRKSARRCGAKHISKWKCTKHTRCGSWDVEKVHAVVARSTFRSQNVKDTRGLDHFWKLRSRKNARHCGTKHILKSKS